MEPEVQTDSNIEVQTESTTESNTENIKPDFAKRKKIIAIVIGVVVLVIIVIAVVAYFLYKRKIMTSSPPQTSVPSSSEPSASSSSSKTSSPDAPVVVLGGRMVIPGNFNGMEFRRPDPTYPRTIKVYSECGGQGTVEEFGLGTHDVEINLATRSMLQHAGLSSDIMGTSNAFDMFRDCLPNGSIVTSLSLYNEIARIDNPGPEYVRTDPVNLVLMILKRPGYLINDALKPEQMVELGVGKHTNVSAGFSPTEVLYFRVPLGFRVIAYEKDELSGPSQVFLGTFEGEWNNRFHSQFNTLPSVSTVVVERT